MAWFPIAMAAVSAVGSIVQGAQAASAANYAADVATQNAQAANAQATIESERIAARGRQQLGRARASIAASGLEPTGTPLKLLADSAANAELDRLTVLYEGDMRARGYRMDAAAYKAEAKSAMIGGYFGAAASAFTGADKAGLFTRTVPGLGSRIGSIAGGYGGKF